MIDYLNLLCAYLIGYQILEVIIYWYYFAPVGALIRVVFRVVFFIAPLWYVCSVVTGRY